MKLIIAGSRHFDLTWEKVEDIIILNNLNPSTVFSGGARGVDYSGWLWAKNNNIPCVLIFADWKTYGKRAGPIRNKRMAEYADELLLIWDGKSKGSKNMKEEMLKLKKPVHEVILNEV